jgi:glycosyltransferase involved in cell wall biosynthesis
VTTSQQADRRVAGIASSLDLSPNPAFLARAEVLRATEPPTPSNQLRVGLRLLRAARRGRPLILYSAWGEWKPDLLVAGLLGLLPRHRRPPVLMVGEVWSPTPGWRQWAERLVVRWADRGIDRYLTTGPSEIPLLTAWGIDPDKIGSCHVPFTPENHQLADSRLPRGNVVFAGGDSLRDYPALLEAARSRPELCFVIATTVLDPASVPPNVVVHPVRIKEYAPLMREAGVVVVPVVPGHKRGAGALTFLMGMWMRKPVVITGSDYSRDYLVHDVTGLLVEGRPADYVAAIDWALDPANGPAVTRLGDAAHDYVETYCTFAGYVADILAELDHLIDQNNVRIRQRRFVARRDVANSIE